MTDEIMIAWAHDRRRLETARNYWLTTVRAGGRPHVAPVWGVWLADRLYFATDPGSVKGRNLAANPQAVVHLDDSTDVLVVEGTATVVADGQVQARAAAAMAAKYVTIRSGRPYRLSMNPGNVLYALVPDRGFAWWEGALDRTSRRYEWSGASAPTRTPDWTPFAP